jgi:hypothetical protein
MFLVIAADDNVITTEFSANKAIFHDDDGDVTDDNNYV